MLELLTDPQAWIAFATLTALELVLEGKVKVKPFVEPLPLKDINRVFEAVHRHEISKRAVLVP